MFASAKLVGGRLGPGFISQHRPDLAEVNRRYQLTSRADCHASGLKDLQRLMSERCWPTMMVSQGSSG